MASKYIDTESAIQVIGCIYKKPTLLGDTRVRFIKEDFTSELHQVIFSAMSNLYNVGGNTKFSKQSIEDYISKFPKSLAIYKGQNGREWLISAVKSANLPNFHFYADRVKKMSLLRGYESAGMDVRFILDPDEVDIEKRQTQEINFDKMSVKELADTVEGQITRVKDEIIEDNDNFEFHAGKDADEYLANVRNDKNRGYELYDRVFSRVVMGARPGKMYLRSASAGTGKTRAMIADVCRLACGEIYENGDWQSIGAKIPTLYIAVEQEPEEIEHMLWSFIANVPSDHIDLNEFDIGEFERVKHAIEIEKDSALHCVFMPDYKLSDVKNVILKGIREWGIQVVGFDYVCSSMSIMNEVTHNAGGVQMREDQILYMMASALKDLATEFGITIITSSQLNGSARMDKTPDANALAGAKSLANRVDVGAIMMDVSKDDLDDIQGFFGIEPNVKLCVFKNRAGRWNRIILWMRADKGVCRYRTVGCTDYKFNIIHLDEIIPELQEDAF